MTQRKARGRPPIDYILTPAEWRVIHAAQHGLTNREIAKKLGVTIDAVKLHIANALAKLQQPNKKALLAWLGEPIDSAISKEIEMNDDVSIGSIGQIARGVSDIAVSEAWYQEVLGLHHLYTYTPIHLYTYGNLAFFDCGGVRLMLSQSDERLKDESIIYLKTNDLKAMHAQLQARGVNFSHAPHMVHKHENGIEEWMAFFVDPDDRPIGLMAQYGP